MMLPRFSKVLLCLLLTVLLTGCFQIQISGTVVGATITITRIDGVGGTIVIGPSTGEGPWIAALGDEYWQALPALWKIWLSGIVQIPGDIAINPQVYYLATASGGVDNDPNRTRDLSDPSAAVTGDLHAIVKGDRLLKGNLQISILTEAFYQVLKSELAVLTGNQIGQRLDQLSKSTLTNVSGEPGIDYESDALYWSYPLYEDSYKGESRRLAEMAELWQGAYSDADAELYARALVEDEDPEGKQAVTVCASVVHQPPPGKPQFLSRIEIDTEYLPKPPGLFTMTIPGANGNEPLTIDVGKETGVFGINSFGSYKIGSVLIGSTDLTAGFAALPSIEVTEENTTLWCTQALVPL